MNSLKKMYFYIIKKYYTYVYDLKNKGGHLTPILGV